MVRVRMVLYIAKEVAYEIPSVSSGIKWIMSRQDGGLYVNLWEHEYLSSYLIADLDVNVTEQK